MEENERGDDGGSTSEADGDDRLPELDSVPLLDLADRRTVRLFGDGLAYVATSRRPLLTLFVGGLLIVPMLVPVIGFLLYVTQSTFFAGESRERDGADHASDGSASTPPDRGQTIAGAWELARRNWPVGVIVAGVKGLVLAFVCLVIPLGLLGTLLGDVLGEFLTGVAELTLGGSLTLLGAAMLVYLYPVGVGTFVEKGDIREAMDAYVDRSALFEQEYVRCIVVVVAYLALAGTAAWLAFVLLGVVGLVLAGPLAFATLLAIHHVIGRSWQAIRGLPEGPVPDDTPGTERTPARPIERDPATSPTSHTPRTSTADEPGSRSDWEPRSLLDRTSAGLYRSIADYPIRWLGLYVVAGSLLQLSVLTTVGVRAGERNLFLAASLVPAVLLAVGVVGMVRPRVTVGQLGTAFLLGVLLAPAGWSLIEQFRPLSSAGIVGVFVFVWLVIAPFEELVKLAAAAVVVLRVRTGDLPTVGVTRESAGTALGAVAGLGFAVMINARFILLHGTGPTPGPTLDELVLTRTVVLPVHVAFSALGGYFLGAAILDEGGTRTVTWPIAIEGLLIATVLHAGYDTFVYVIDFLVASGRLPRVAFFGYIVGFVVVSSATLLWWLRRRRTVWAR